MNLGGSPAVHLTYCTNIHPGETWAEVRQNLESHLLNVRRSVCGEDRFGIGLRLSGQASAELGLGDELERFASWLEANNLYVFTINGFPHGRFHGERVKEKVYRPDWLEDERLSYTDLLAEQLARLLPSGDDILGSVSTVPGAFRPRGARDAGPELMAHRILRHVAGLHALEERTGRTVTLAIEPEPSCHMETVPETISFIEEQFLCHDALAELGNITGLSSSQAEDFVRRHLGLCLDTCHAAVEFEDPEECVDAVAAAGLSVFKMQISAGLRLDTLTPEMADALENWDDEVYLHQVVSRSEDGLERYVDLPEALGAYRKKKRESPDWRVHFHVPLFRRELGTFTNTQDFLEAILDRQKKEPFTTHLEVETYTWDVLPAEFRGATVDEDVARELGWVLERLAT